VRLARGELDDRARLGLAQRERARADLLVLRVPLEREVAVQVGLVVRKEMRRRDRRAVEVLDDALGVDLVVRPRILERALEQQPLRLARFDELAARVGLAHDHHQPVAVDVLRNPARVVAVKALVARHAAHVPPGLQHALCAVGGHPRQDVEQHAAQPLAHVRRKPVQILVRVRVQPDRVLGDRKRGARAAHLGRMHVSVDPDARARAIRVGTDRQHPQVASAGGLSDRFEPHDVGMRLGPAANLRCQLFVVEVTRAKKSGHRALIAK
jgi:hypothetical protein